MKKFDVKKNYKQIVNFIEDYFTKNCFKKAVIGLSGGIDSAVSTVLAAKALGSNNIKALLLPYKKSSSKSIELGLELANKFNISKEIIEITPSVESYYTSIEENNTNHMRLGNFLARVRMCVLYDQAAKENALVIGTGNKSELLTGYCTQYGDNACSIEPIGHIYKTEVYQMGVFLGIPQSILSQKPTADLWEGQSDEEEMGISYKKLDNILYNLIDLKKTDQELLDLGFDSIDIKKVKIMYSKSEFKRRMPLSLENIWSC